MALCSQAFSASKRSCDFSRQHDGPASKRSCLSKIDINSPVNRRLPQVCFDAFQTNACYSSSSDSVSDSEDYNTCYIADQIRAKRRASSRISFSLDKKLSQAVSQYSDDEDADYQFMTASASSNAENLDCKLSSSPSASSVCINNTNRNKQVARRSNSTGSFLQISDSCSSNSSSSKRSMPDSDKNSRSRCFDYLVGAIDEAWARYCNAASSIEDETYGYNSPSSTAGSDDEDDCGNTTDLTDYESEPETQMIKPVMRRKPSIFGSAMPQSSLESTSTDADLSSCHLQALKDRLIKAKYFLQDLVDSDDYNDALDFWKRWDMIKYATIELVEDDDDDSVVEATIDDLEDGRYFTN